MSHSTDEAEPPPLAAYSWRRRRRRHGRQAARDRRGDDRCLAALYEPGAEGAGGRRRSGGLGGSATPWGDWLGDIRSFFPSSVVRVMQQDAMQRLNLKQLLLEPEMMQTVIPDVHLVADLLALSGVMPAKAKETARIVVRKCVEDLERRLAEPMRQAVVAA